MRPGTGIETQKREERGGGRGQGEKPARGGRREGGRRYFEGVGPRWGPRERGPLPQNTKRQGLEGAVLGFRGKEESGEAEGLRSVVGLLLHPTWRDRKKETEERSTRTERKRSLE